MSAKPMAFLPSALRVLRLLRPHRALVAAVVALGVTSVTLTVLGPRLLGIGTDIVFAGAIGSTLAEGESKAEVIAALRASGDDSRADFLNGIALTPGRGIDFAALSAVLATVLILYIIASVFSWAQGRLLNTIVQRTVFTLREEVQHTINRLPLAAFDRRPRGDLLSRVTNDVDNVAQSLQQSLSQILTALLTVVGILVMMFLTSPLLAVVSLVAVPLTILITGVIAKRSQSLFVAQWARTGDLNAQVEEAVSGHALVTAFGRRDSVEADFRTTNDELFRVSFGAQFVSGIIMPAMMFIGNLVYVVIAVVGGLQVAAGSLSLGAVQAFIQYSRQFTQPLTQLGSMVNLLQSGVASAERVFELLDTEPQSPDPRPAASPVASAGRLEFDDVTFGYVPDAPLIEGLHLTVEPGQTIAIVGPTGAGKTTLVNLILRFWELDRGRISLDGVDIAAMTRRDLRSRTSMVLQDTWLFSGTIRENIAYARPDASEEEILTAARATFVDRFVRSLPDGYDTVLDDDATTVSAGEKQLITIARAFLAAPDVLILDEATSSVDTRTERLIQHAMSALRADRTSFVIAHRLSTIRDADVILVLEAGRIVEQGDHDTLLAARGPYHALYSAQFSSGSTDEIE